MVEGIAGILGSVLGNGAVGALGRLGMQVGAGTVLLKYSRDDEAQFKARREKYVLATHIGALSRIMPRGMTATLLMAASASSNPSSVCFT